MKIAVVVTPAQAGGIHRRGEAAPRPYDRRSRASGNPVRPDVDPRPSASSGQAFRGNDRLGVIFDAACVPEDNFVLQGSGRIVIAWSAARPWPLYNSHPLVTPKVLVICEDCEKVWGSLI
jgi:hypothetical protein